MPLPYFHRRPSQPQGLFGEVQAHVQSTPNGSSTETSSSDSSSESTTPHSSPRPRRVSFFRRASVVQPRTPVVDPPRESTESRSPLRPSQPQYVGRFHENMSTPHIGVAAPAASRTTLTGPDPEYGSVDPETAQLAFEIHRKRRRHRKAWTRKKKDRGNCFPGMKNRQARRKAILCVISGTLLSLVLTIYLAVALSLPHIGEEVHVLFILVILCITILFCHSLVRLCMFALQPSRPRNSSATQRGLTATADPNNFVPTCPIRVYTGDDEELGINGSPEIGADLAPEVPEVHPEIDPEKEAAIKPPPPAYGLWRSSVRVDPNLMHWQRVDIVHNSIWPPAPANTSPAIYRHHSAPTSPTGPMPGAYPGSGLQQQQQQPPQPQLQPLQQQEMVQVEGPRPPSYISDDGVRYVVEAQPRSMTQVAPPTRFVTMSPPPPMLPPLSPLIMSPVSFVMAPGPRTPSFVGDVHPGYRWMIVPGSRAELP